MDEIDGLLRGWFVFQNSSVDPGCFRRADEYHLRSLHSQDGAAFARTKVHRRFDRRYLKLQRAKSNSQHQHHSMDRAVL
jgi:hypothetical protein